MLWYYRGKTFVKSLIPYSYRGSMLGCERGRGVVGLPIPWKQGSYQRLNHPSRWGLVFTQRRSIVDAGMPQGGGLESRRRPLTITPDDVRGYKAAQNKVYGRKIVNRLYEIYSKELNNKRFAYDGDGSTVGGDLKRSKRSGVASFSGPATLMAITQTLLTWLVVYVHAEDSTPAFAPPRAASLLIQKMEEPSVFLEEDREWMRSDPILRVEKMFKKLETKFTEPPRFILCVLPERKICDIYGESKPRSPWLSPSITTSITYILPSSLLQVLGRGKTFINSVSSLNVSLLQSPLRTNIWPMSSSKSILR
ncbi:hypothetical protein B296_00004626 [Ensete ventricosum]|uniref:Uncharacterized protein n=1 Tax=Ensete ventricosum TaxID=4639 RepID=A0A427AKF5_ENSVE|nr:hypothetical protein B296_00004626 [Ensete ventricosum]